MGAIRNGQDPYARPWISPKLIVAGCLSGTVDGRPVEITCEGHHVQIAMPGVLSAWRLQGRSIGASTALKLVDRVGLGLTLSVGRLTLQVLPTPHPLVRWFGPELS